MTTLHPDLLTVLDAVKIHSPTAYSVHGEPREIPEPSEAGVSPGDPARGSERCYPRLRTISISLYTCGRPARRSFVRVTSWQSEIEWRRRAAQLGLRPL